MPTHIINKQLYDFTYASETVALTVQKQLQHYTCNEVNMMLGRILDETFDKEEYYFFDKLEIDLGALNLEELETDELLVRLKTGLTEQLQKLKHESPAQVPHSHPAYTITKNFLTNGDVPWWLDKAETIQLDAWLEKMLATDKNALAKIIETAASPETVLHRVISYYQLNHPEKLKELLKNPVIVKKLENSRSNLKETVNKLAETEKNNTGMHDVQVKNKPGKQAISFTPGYSPEKHVERDILKAGLFNPGNLLLQWRQLSDSLLRILQTSLSHHSETANEPGIDKLIDLLYLKHPAERKRILETLSFFSQPEITAVLQLLNSTETVTTPALRSKKIYRYFKRLPAFQLQWLLALATIAADENRPGGSDELINNKNQTAADDSIITGDISTADLSNITQKPVDSGVSENETHIDNADFLTADETVKQSSVSIQDDKSIPATEHPLAKAYVEPIENKTATNPSETVKNTIATITNIENEIADDLKLIQTNETPRHLSTETVKKEKAIAYISNKLASPNFNLWEFLHQMPSVFLFDLESTFRQLEKRESALRKMIKTILSHDYFFQYNLLTLLMEMGDEKIETGLGNETFVAKKRKDKKETSINYIRKKIAPAQKLLAAQLNALSINETAILKDVLAKQSAASATEKKLLQKLTAALPPEAISFLHFFTQLEETEIQKMVKPKQQQPGLLFFHTNEEEETGNKIHITNAGLCLLAPYLPAFFKNLHLLEANQFKSTIAAQKAVYLLQYMAGGGKKFPEYLLQLNKILCGFAITDPLFGKIQLTKTDRAEANALLEAIINNWKALKNTSIQGLQDSFLQRKGILTEHEKSWTLQVEKKGYDMLIDSLPWGFNMIKFPWMKKHMVTEW